MSAALREQVRHRARLHCEYCQMPEAFDSLVFHWDHIIAQKHRGLTELSILAWSCFSCNLHKQSDIAGIDPEANNDKVIRLFNPRKDKWHDHFQWINAELKGRTSIGRVTVYVLAINLPHRVALRRFLNSEGLFVSS